MNEDRGLYSKFVVLDPRHDYKPVAGCFVLRPVLDPAAREALERYAESTPNKALSSDLWEWLYRIAKDRREW